jgi:hypothetical protein
MKKLLDCRLGSYLKLDTSMYLGQLKEGIIGVTLWHMSCFLLPTPYPKVGEYFLAEKLPISCRS